MNPKIALVLAYAGKMHQLFEALPKDDSLSRAMLLKMASHFLDHTRPDRVLASVPRLKDESSVSYLLRNHERIRTLPVYRWPVWPIPAERMPQALFGPMEALKQLMRGEALPPREVLTLLSWLEPVWDTWPQLKDPVNSYIAGLTAQSLGGQAGGSDA